MELGWLTVVLALTAGVADGGDSEAAVTRARAELAAKLGVAGDRLSLVDVRPARWGDTSLGCAQKGRAYQPVTGEGHVVHLRLADRTYDVRVAGERALVCESAEGAAAQAVAAAQVARLARRDLARRLNLPESDVHVERVRPSTWPDASLGCGEAPAAPPVAAEVRGFLVELTAGGARHEYHADMERVVACAPGGPATPKR